MTWWQVGSIAVVCTFGVGSLVCIYWYFSKKAREARGEGISAAPGLFILFLVSKEKTRGDLSHHLLSQMHKSSKIHQQVQ